MLGAAIAGLALLVAACGNAAPASSALITQAHQIVTQLAGGRDTAVEAQMAAVVQKKLSASQLAAAWKRATAALGVYRSQSKTVSGPAAGGTEVVVTCTFAHGTLDVRLHFDAQRKVDGLYLQSHPTSS